MPALRETPHGFTPRPRIKNCSGVVVTYNPDEGLPERLGRIAGQVSRVYVVDNASNEAERRMLAHVARMDSRITLVLAASNEGIASALNRGCDRALADGFAWGVTCDQDSVVEPDLVEELGSLWSEHPDRERIGIVAPNYVMAGSGSIGVSFPPGGQPWKETSTAITSGALLSLDAYRRVGPFRSDYFIDMVDEEFCLRLREQGMIVICSRKPLMLHPLGSERKHALPFGLLPGRGIVVSNHAAFRRYYMVRNRLLTLKRHATREPRWALRVVRDTMMDLVRVGLFEDDRRAKLSAMGIGLWHGMIGRSGKADRAF